MPTRSARRPTLLGGSQPEGRCIGFAFPARRVRSHLRGVVELRGVRGDIVVLHEIRLSLARGESVIKC